MSTPRLHSQATIASSLLLAILLCPTRTAAVELAPGSHTVELLHEGRARSYSVYVPPQAARNGLPVVLNFHGGGGNAIAQQRYARMDAVARREGFVVLYPNGSGTLRTRLLTWNAGTCCGYAQKQNVDDVGFVRRVLDDLALRSRIDRTRIYATGLSNGAMMAYRLAAEAPNLVAAIGPVAGSMVAQSIAAGPPVPILHIHSVDDPRALYAGGLGPPFPFTNTRVLHPPVEQVIARWVEHNGCPNTPHIDSTQHGHGPSAEHTATRLVYGPCAAGSEVALLKLTGAGHIWPGGEMNYFPRVLGQGSDVIDANEEMWRFFSRFQRQ